MDDEDLATWYECDHFLLHDSDCAEENSQYSWNNESEYTCKNWKGWKSEQNSTTCAVDGHKENVKSLVEIAAQCVALHIPYEVVEKVNPPVPEELQLRIEFWSFPDREDDIRLYSCLANSNSIEFSLGENLFKSQAVKNSVQIGFHLSANVDHIGSAVFNVAITFDRKKITSCNCTCQLISNWCSHVVAVCLHRIYRPEQVSLRAPISESLSRLDRDQLQKFAQYLICELPQQILPVAQRLLDSLLSSHPTAINSMNGAPDPTAGASVNEQTTWFLDEKILRYNIKKSLTAFCIPSPLVLSNVDTLLKSIPPVTVEWTSIWRSLQGHKPEGLWNLLSIVREMFRKNDKNALHLLEVISEEVIEFDKIIVWWFDIRLALYGGRNEKIKSTGFSDKTSVASAIFCDEMVTLWRLAALNPSISPNNKTSLKIKFQDWQEKIFSIVIKRRNTSNSKLLNHFHQDTHAFDDFKLAREACDLDWEDYIKCTGTAIHFMRDHADYKECDSSIRNSAQICMDESVLDLGSNQQLNYKNMITSYPLDDKNASSYSGSEVYLTNESLSESARKFSSFNASTNSSLSTKLITPHQISIKSSESQSNDEDNRSTLQKSTSQTTSPPDVDEYNFLYYYDVENLASTLFDNSAKKISKEKISGVQQPPTSKASISINSLVKLDAEWETMFLRAEALYAYGRTNEACVLCVKLVDQFLKNPPNFIIELSPSVIKEKPKKINSICHQLSTLASEILRKSYFMCLVLTHQKEYYLHAFKIGLYGLEMPRLPASTKLLEVKMAHLEEEILNNLKRMLPLGKEQVDILQNRAKLLRDGKYKTRGESLLPLSLATFIFECLSMCQFPSQTKVSDETLGFEASVAALGMKSNVSEAEHPLLCEGIRRQRGDLATNILTHYYNNPTRLAMTMDKLLDKDIYPFLQSAMDVCWYQISDPRNLPLMTMKNVANSNIHNQPLQCHNQNVNNVPGVLNANLVVETLNSLPVQTYNSCNSGFVSHKKDNRYKKKHLYPNQPHQASEANAHHIFKLGKTILSKMDKMIHTACLSQSPLRSRPYCALHMCAFQLSLYSLGLLNRVTPNWSSRNYSLQVNWIAHNALNIGTPAILFLLGTWEGLLTPTEVANIANKISTIEHNELNTVEAAAELALSCLKHSGAMNSNEINRAIIQCKKQSDHMMETACLTVERAAKNGIVFSEVLFNVARHWFDLYIKNANIDEDSSMLEVDHREEFKRPYVYQANYSTSVDTSQQPPPPPLCSHQLAVPPQTCPDHLYRLSYFPDQSIPQNTLTPNDQQPNTLIYFPYIPVSTPNQYSQYYSPCIPNSMQYQNANLQCLQQRELPQYFVQPPNQNEDPIISLPQQVQENICPRPNTYQIRYLESAYRVGLLALDTMARRYHGPNLEFYSRNPTFSNDIQMLLRLSKKLGPNYIQQLCLAVTNSVVNPFTLHDVAIEAVIYLGRFNPNPTTSSTLRPLIKKCQTMYIQLLHLKCNQLLSSDYVEYVGIIISAYDSFAMTPEGSNMFKNWLQSFKRSEQCTKELWTMITNSLPPTLVL